MLPGDLLWGPLLKATGELPIPFVAQVCDLRPRFLPKCRVGQGYRAIARNGRVLLATDRTLAELAGNAACIRLQVWHRAVLPGDEAEPYGALLCVRGDAGQSANSTYRLELVSAPEPGFDLALDVGGQRVLEFRRVKSARRWRGRVKTATMP